MQKEMEKTELKFTKKLDLIIDTHCHLDDKKFLEDLPEVLQRAKEMGVGGVLLAGADINDLDKAREISHAYENVFYAAGVHPYHFEEYDEKILRNYLQDERCIAVGECGLDYFRLPKDEDEKIKEKAGQKEVFISQIKLAEELKKPIIVHVRDANSDSLEILKEYAVGKVTAGVLHCYNASEILLELANKNFYYGIGGVLTFNNAKKLVEVLSKIPLDKLVLETDAPYLTPHPHRGKRNEPGYTSYVAQKVSEILNLPLDDVKNITTNNAINLFKEFKKVILVS